MPSPYLHATIALGLQQQRLPGLGPNRGNDDGFEPCAPGALEHLSAIGVEAGHVEVAMGVDHFGARAMSASCCDNVNSVDSLANNTGTPSSMRYCRRRRGL